MEADIGRSVSETTALLDCGVGRVSLKSLKRGKVQQSHKYGSIHCDKHLIQENRVFRDPSVSPLLTNKVRGMRDLPLETKAPGFRNETSWDLTIPRTSSVTQPLLEREGLYIIKAQPEKVAYHRGLTTHKHWSSIRWGSLLLRFFWFQMAFRHAYLRWATHEAWLSTIFAIGQACPEVVTVCVGSLTR